MIDASVALLNIPANKALWTGNATFSAAVSSVTTNMGTLNSADTTRLAGPAPFTETKGQARAALITITMQHAAAGKGYAAGAGNTSMKTICSITESSLVHTPDADLGNACMNIYNAVQPFIGSMGAWNVNATTLGVFNTDITTFASLVGTPQAQISTQNAAATAIDTQIETMEGIFENTLDTLMVQFKTSHAAFYNGYKSARVIHSTGVHHSTTFTGFVYKTGGAALQHAEIELTLSGNKLRKHFTAADGHYRFTRLHLGTYELTISCAGYTTQTKSFTITTLQSVDTDFTLVATTGGGGTAPTGGGTTTGGTTPPAGA